MKKIIYGLILFAIPSAIFCMNVKKKHHSATPNSDKKILSLNSRSDNSLTINSEKKRFKLPAQSQPTTRKENHDKIVHKDVETERHFIVTLNQVDYNCRRCNKAKEMFCSIKLSNLFEK